MWEVGERLRERREELDLTQGQIAEYEQISKSYLSQLESGTNQPNWELLKRFAVRYRTSVDYLLGLTDDPNPYPRTKLSKPERDMVKRMQELSEDARKMLLEIAGVIQRNDSDQPMREMMHLDAIITESFDEDTASKLRDRIRARWQGNVTGGLSDAFGSSI